MRTTNHSKKPFPNYDLRANMEGMNKLSYNFIAVGAAS